MGTRQEMFGNNDNVHNKILIADAAAAAAATAPALDMGAARTHTLDQYDI